MQNQNQPNAGSQQAGAQRKGKEVEAEGAEREASGGDGLQGKQLEQFVSYVQENWKPILTELVAAGVTAYLTHNASSKERNQNQKKHS